MTDLYLAAQKQATALRDTPVALLFSGGKDAVAMADLWLKYHEGPKRWVFFYFVDGLEIVESVLRHYEQRWNITIDRRPCHETVSLMSRANNNGRKYKFADVEKNYKAEVGINWSVTGIKRCDSLARRGMLKALGAEGIDQKQKRVYPVIDWSNKQALAYCKMNKLPLGVNYTVGINFSFWLPNDEYLIWLRGRYPDDFKKIVDTFPQYGDAVFRRERGL